MRMVRLAAGTGVQRRNELRTHWRKPSDSILSRDRSEVYPRRFLCQIGEVVPQSINFPEPVILDEQATKLGAVETWEHAQKCAGIFDENRHRIDGILVSLPNFGDENGIAETIKLSGLNVPILVQAYPDDLSKFNV